MARKDFDSLTKAEQRVGIAKDLIARLRTGRFIPRQGTYLTLISGERFLYDKKGDAQLQEVLKGEECKGCQIGGMFLCAIDRHNKLMVCDIRYTLDNDTAMRDYLTQWFTRREIDAMEQAFEGWRKYEKWADKVPDSTKRMRLIAKNIIQNNGRFVGKQLLAT